MRILLIAQILILAVFLSCNGGGGTENHPPVILSINANPAIIGIGQTTTLIASASDEDEDDLTYVWSSLFGEFPQGSIGPQVIWRSPDSLGKFEIVLKVTDNKDTVSSKIFVETRQVPLLKVNTTSLDFSTNIENLFVIIRNEGTGEMSWKVTTNEDWINVFNSEGKTEENGKDTINLGVSRNNKFHGSYNGFVTIDAGAGGKIDIDVKMVVVGILTLVPSNLDLGYDKEEGEIEVKNSGDGLFKWVATPQDNWIDVSPDSGITGKEQSAKLKVFIDKTGFSEGLYQGSVIVNAGDVGSEQLLVSFRVSPPAVLKVTPDTLDFQIEYNELPVFVKNIGSGKLNWKARADKSWISFSPDAGTTEVETDTVLVKVNREGLPSRILRGYAIFDAGQSGVDSVRVIMEAGTPEPILNVNPPRIDFGATRREVFLFIENTGTGRMDWNISKKEDWLSLSKQSGTLRTGEIDSISVTADRSRLEKGNYYDTLLVDGGDGGSFKIPVSLVVAEEKVILLDNFSTLESPPWYLCAFTIDNDTVITHLANTRGQVCFEAPDNRIFGCVWLEKDMQPADFLLTWDMSFENESTTSIGNGTFWGAGVMILGDENYPVEANIYEFWQVGLNIKPNGNSYIIALGREKGKQDIYWYSLNRETRLKNFDTEQEAYNRLQLEQSGGVLNVYCNGRLEYSLSGFQSQFEMIEFRFYNGLLNNIVCFDNLKMVAYLTDVKFSPVYKPVTSIDIHPVPISPFLIDNK